MTEVAILLLVLWPAWRSHLWAVGIQAAVLLFVVGHSYWILINDPWVGGAGNPGHGNAEVWGTGIGVVFIILNIPLLVVIVVEVEFLIDRLRKPLPGP
ncbi:hypothetical protein [Specibacter cremeus]|uniref:hypothetical protein n=1 Tax=Specibacter cremeus TaxID=1629051 RepID=UPI000F79F1FE|nr:hypothetical protein [Specibacter cremeus]